MNKSLLKFITDFGPLLIFFTIYYKNGNNLSLAIPPLIISTIVAVAIVYIVEKKIPYVPLFGAIMGLTLSVFLTTTTQIVYPLITGGKPILSIFAMLVIMYEMTMLSAVVTTVIGILFESRLPDISMNVYDTRITEGLIGVSLVCSTDKKDIAEKALKDAGAMEIKSSGK